ncbi:dicarboxylic amino acid permease [Trichomonascus vanleenenianus]|uniref:dicarboxylic amino acid permease n=1 Tax=Trichomonascus vanleenenianus TaxID=2268995 RepID=UPI003ECA273C
MEDKYGSITVDQASSVDLAKHPAEEGRLAQLLGSPENTTAKGLRSRHITFIALGGTIGTGIFLSIGSAISLTGPGGALVTYIVVGIFVLSVVVCLCEMASYIPTSGAFAHYGTRFVDESFGFALGINYYLQWAFSIPSELTAAAIIARFWTTAVPSWAWAIIFIVPIFVIQMINVRSYGELEYWGTLVKVVFIVLFIIVGLLYDWGGVPTAVEPSPGLSNWQNGQAFIGGFSAFFQGVIYAFYSFGGTELVALAAGETRKPWKSIPRAARTTVVRILLFMILTVLVIGLCINSSDPTLLNAMYDSDVAQSPITTIFVKAGFGAAKHVVNAILLVAVLTAINSCFYASSRMLMAMAHEGKMFKVFGWTNRRGVPVASLLLTLAISCLVFLTTIWGEGVVFTWFLNITGASAILTWLSIGIINIRFRLALKKQKVPLNDLPLRQYFFPVLPVLVICLGLFLFVGMGYGSVMEEPFSWKNPFGTYLGAAVFFLTYTGWKITHWHTDKFKNLAECDLLTDLVWPAPGEGHAIMQAEKERKVEKLKANRSVYGKLRYRAHQLTTVV